MYIRTICSIGDDIRQVGKYYPGNFGAPGMGRERKRNRTTEEIRKANQRNRIRKVQRIILANFRHGRTVHLTYRKEDRPETFEEALQHRKRFMDRMRAVCRKAGIPWKWIGVTERGKKGKALHHHLIVEDLTEPVDILRTIGALWKYGRVTSTAMEEEDDLFEGLAEYLLKKETKEDEKGTSYSHSRNLIIPKEKKEKVRARKWNREPRPPRGWYVVKGSLWNAYTPEGWPVQRYTLRRLEVDMWISASRRVETPTGRDFGGLKS